jgi:prepilin-type N-terminal cleavage/methylation domain-containing protein
MRFLPTPVCWREARAAFTLLELLVVLALASILAATLLPALAKSQPNSLALQCLNNNRQLCRAWRMYADDSRDRIVYAADDGSGTLHPQNQYAWTWSHLDCYGFNAYNWDTNADIVLRPLWPYTGRDASIYRCPADKSFIVANDGAAKQRVRSFSMNTYLGGYGGSCSLIPGGCTYRIFLKTTDLTAPGPAKTFVFIEERPEVINWGDFYTDMAGSPIPPRPSDPSAYTFDIDVPAITHDLAGSLSFGDGHVEMHRWQRVLQVLSCSTGTYHVPGSPDVAWLQDHATRPN